GFLRPRRRSCGSECRRSLRRHPGPARPPGRCRRPPRSPGPPGPTGQPGSWCPPFAVLHIVCKHRRAAASWRNRPCFIRPRRSFMPAVPLSQVAVPLRPEDNIAVAARNLPAGLEVQSNGHPLTLARRVGLGHKVALRDIRQGEAVYKYGQIIGFASEDIPAGGHVHVHNLRADAFERDYAFCRDCPPPPSKPDEHRFFQGYDRVDARYGTRNYIPIISTVNFSASTSKYIAETA